MSYTPYYAYPNQYYPAPMQDYARMQQPQMAQQAQAQTAMQGGVQWVSGELEANNYLIAPNSAVALWDSSAPRVYLKQADASGRPTLKAYDLVERPQTVPDAPQAPAASYVTRNEFDELAATVRGLQAKKKQKEDGTDE